MDVVDEEVEVEVEEEVVEVVDVGGGCLSFLGVRTVGCFLFAFCLRVGGGRRGRGRNTKGEACLTACLCVRGRVRDCELLRWE